MKNHYWRIGATIIILGSFVFPASPAFAIYVAQFYADSAAVTPGQSTTIHGWCTDQDGIDLFDTATGAEVAQGGTGAIAYQTPALYAARTYRLECHDTRTSNTVYASPGYLTINMVPDNCPTISTASGAGLLVSPGVHNVVGAGQDFCVNNQSGNTYFVSTISGTDITTFKSAVQGYLSGSVSYFARTAGY